MDEVVLQTGNWRVSCLSKDGGRLKTLSYDGHNLLTNEPVIFNPPKEDYGRYETRPVYGYDDCFPTVDACKDVSTVIDYPDHGELCWLQWDVISKDNSLICSVESRLLHIKFIRKLIFSDEDLCWQFELINLSNKDVPFLHVMHPLMPLEQITRLKLPSCESLFDEINNIGMNSAEIENIDDYLLDLPKGKAAMILMRGVRQNSLEIEFKSRLKLNIEFDLRMFGTLGIWWNNGGYPDEDGLRRIECAFEPMAGDSSSLLGAAQKGLCTKAKARKTLKWNINWKVKV